MQLAPAMLPTLVLAFAVVNVVAVPTSTSSVNWNYDRCDKERGPAAWPQSTQQGCSTVSSQTHNGLEHEQSPIDLCNARNVGSETFPVENIPHVRLLFTSRPRTSLEEGLGAWNETIRASISTTDGVMKMKGLSHPTNKELLLDAGSLPVRVNRQNVSAVPNFQTIEWKLGEIWFHWGRDGYVDEGSEHFIEGQQHALELQVLFFNGASFKNLNQALSSGRNDSVLAMSQLYAVDDTKSESQSMRNIVASLATAQSQKTVATMKSEMKAEFRAAELLDSMSTSACVRAVLPGGTQDLCGPPFYAYGGTLTTSACSLGVSRVVLGQIKTLKSATLAQLKLVSSLNGIRMSLHGTARPLQALGARDIVFSGIVEGERTRPCHPSREPYYTCPSAPASTLLKTTLTECDGTCIGLAVGFCLCMIFVCFMVYKYVVKPKPSEETASEKFHNIADSDVAAGIN